jgi:hypothetical protein
MEEHSMFINPCPLDGGSVRNTVNLLEGFIFPVDYSGSDF